MRVRTSLLVLVLLGSSSGIALAGFDHALPVPTLGDAGLVMLALGLVSGGIAALRSGRKH